ncbi:MAG: hypothetical protein J6T63_01770 [Bacteroidales bacterium]|nr:hypothetical protein [Bacteroidales bacterium]
MKVSGSLLRNPKNRKAAKLNRKVQDDSSELQLELESRPPLVERVKATLAEVEAEWAEELKEYRKSASGKEGIWENYEQMSEAQRAEVDKAFDELGEILDEYGKWSKDLDDWLAANDLGDDLDDEDLAECDEVISNLDKIIKENDEYSKNLGRWMKENGLGK